MTATLNANPQAIGRFYILIDFDDYYHLQGLEKFVRRKIEQAYPGLVSLSGLAACTVVTSFIDEK